jgi:hypothetical protein
MSEINHSEAERLLHTVDNLMLDLIGRLTRVLHYSELRN